MISNEANDLLFIHPGNTVSQPLVDELTRKMASAYRKATPSRYGSRGVHRCTGNRCGVTSSNRDYVLPNGLVTNSLSVHYLAFHRDDVPVAELDKVRALSCGEVEPNAAELAAPGFRPDIDSDVMRRVTTAQVLLRCP